MDASRLQQMCTHTHSAMQICQCPLLACVCVCVWLAVTCCCPLLTTPLSSHNPLTSPPPTRTAVCCLVSSFCFQTGVKETNHLHTAFPLPLHPYPSLIQQINGHKARAALWDEQGNLRGVRRVGVATPQPQLVCIAPKIIAHINC